MTEGMSAIEQVRYSNAYQLFNEWENIAIDLLKRATGVEWTAETKIELWDAQITFKHNDITRTTQSLSLNEDKENNFSLVLCTVMEIIYYWRRKI